MLLGDPGIKTAKHNSRDKCGIKAVRSRFPLVRNVRGGPAPVAFRHAGNGIPRWFKLHAGPASHLHRCAQEDLFHGLGSLPKPARRGSKGTIVPMPSLSGPKKSYCSVEQLLGGPLHHARTVRLSNPTMRASCLPQNGQGSVLGVFQPLHALVQAALPNLRHMPLACLGFPGAGPLAHSSPEGDARIQNCQRT